MLSIKKDLNSQNRVHQLLTEHERQLLDNAESTEGFANALEHSAKLEKKFNKLMKREGTSVGGG